MLKLSRDLACLILRQDSEAGSAVSPSLDEAEVGGMTKVGREQAMPYGETAAAPAETCCFRQARPRVLSPEIFDPRTFGIWKHIWYRRAPQRETVIVAKHPTMHRTGQQRYFRSKNITVPRLEGQSWHSVSFQKVPHVHLPFSWSPAALSFCCASLGHRRLQETTSRRYTVKDPPEHGDVIFLLNLTVRHQIFLPCLPPCISQEGD